MEGGKPHDEKYLQEGIAMAFMSTKGIAWVSVTDFCFEHLQEGGSFLFVYESKNPNYKHANTTEILRCFIIFTPPRGDMAGLFEGRRMDRVLS